MDKQKSVVYVVPSASLGGAETVVAEIAKNHDQARFRACFLLIHDGPLASRLRAIPGIEVEICPFAVRLRYPWSGLRAALWIRKNVQKHQAQVVHFTMAYAVLFGFLVSRGFFIQRRVLLWFQHGPVGGWMDWLPLFRPMDALLTNSNYTLESQIQVEGLLGKIFGLKRTLKVLTLGISPIPAAASTSSTTLRIAMLTRLQKWKGVDLFMEAIQKLRNQHPSLAIDAKIYGAQTAAPGSDAYADHVRVRAQANSVELCPAVGHFSELQGRVDVLVNASIQPEPFGLTLIEAMHLGVVAVAPRHGGPVEIIQHGKNGILFEPGNSDSLAKAIHDIAVHPELRRSLCTAALQDAHNRFSAKRMVLELERSYEDLLQARCNH